MNKKIIIALFLVYFLSRLINLMTLPIFNDEAFFIWAGRQIFANPAANLFINFTDGKEPLFFWLFSLFSHSLLTARLFSVGLGALALLFVWKIGGKSAALVYLVSPFLLLTQRLAVQENLLMTLLAAAIYFRRHWLVGVFAALAMFTKTTAALYLLPLVTKKNIMWLIFAGLVYLPIFATSVFVHNRGYAGWGADFVTNLQQAISWLVSYQGWPVVLLGLFAPFIIKTPEKWLWWLWCFVPIVVECAIARIFFPRYFVFSVVPLAFLVGGVIKKYKIALVALIPNVLLSWQIVSNIAGAPIPYIDRWQYLESWPAGYGVPEAAKYLASQNAKNVVTEDIMVTRFGLPYYYPDASYHLGTEGEYYVFTRMQEPPSDKRLVLRFFQPKIGGKERITVYQKI